VSTMLTTLAEFLDSRQEAGSLPPPNSISFGFIMSATASLNASIEDPLIPNLGSLSEYNEFSILLNDLFSGEVMQDCQNETNRGTRDQETESTLISPSSSSSEISALAVRSVPVQSFEATPPALKV